MEAVSLNKRELSILEGRYPLPVKPTLIPVSDGVGRVIRVGAAVRDLEAGDRVAGAVFPQWLDGPFSLEQAAQLGGSLDGMLAEYACLDGAAAIRIPESIPPEQASCLPCAGVTAWHALQAGSPLSRQSAPARLRPALRQLRPSMKGVPEVSPHPRCSLVPTRDAQATVHRPVGKRVTTTARGTEGGRRFVVLFRSSDARWVPVVRRRGGGLVRR